LRPLEKHGLVTERPLDYSSQGIASQVSSSGGIIDGVLWIRGGMACSQVSALSPLRWAMARLTLETRRPWSRGLVRKS